MNVDLHLGDCVTYIRTLESESVHAVVTDPPYHLTSIVKRFSKEKPSKSNMANGGAPPPFARHSKGFLGKAWDGGDIAFRPEVWIECLRVLKPGGYLLAFGGTRTYHRLACAIEYAGFEIRDMLEYCYGSGFPKSHSVHKAIQSMLYSRYEEKKCVCLEEKKDSSLDSRNGRDVGNNVGLQLGKVDRVERVAGKQAKKMPRNTDIQVETRSNEDTVFNMREGSEEEAKGRSPVKKAVLLKGMRESGSKKKGHRDSQVRAGVEERQGKGFEKGQDLPDVRKNKKAKRRISSRPSSKTVSVRRRESNEKSNLPVFELPPHHRGSNDAGFEFDKDRSFPRKVIPDYHFGREGYLVKVCSWCGLPSQEWLDSIKMLGTALKPAHEPVVLARKPVDGTIAENVIKHGTGAMNIEASRVGNRRILVNTYRDRNYNWGVGTKGDMAEYDGGEHIGNWPANIIHDGSHEVLKLFPDGTDSFFKSCPFQESDFDWLYYCSKPNQNERDGNSHPTVKPVSLMQYLVNMVTVRGATVLDPFLGSGTTGVACAKLGRNFIGCDIESEYIEIARRRIEEAQKQMVLL